MGKLAGKDDDIIEQYLNGATGDQLGKKYGCARNSIYELLKRNNISRRQQIIYPVNEHYFDRIDHPNKAFILGFFYGDSSNDEENNRVRIQLAKKDKELLVKFREILSSSQRPLYRDKRDGSYSLEISNKHLSKQLKKLGMMQRKTFKIRVPFEYIKGYENHFVRGYLEADGTISKRTKGNRWDITITSNKMFIKDLKFLLEKELKFGFNSIIEKPNPNTCELRISDKKKIYKFLTWLYDDAELYLERKYQKAQQFFDEWS